MFKKLIIQEETYWNHSHAMLVTMQVCISISLSLSISNTDVGKIMYQVAPLVINLCVRSVMLITIYINMKVRSNRIW